MERLLKKLTLDNGLVLRVTDKSTRYYADFWNLKVVIKARMKVTPVHLRVICPANPFEQEAKEALGAEVIYQRELTRIGVREVDKEETIHRLVESFEKNTLPYLRNLSFPQKLVLHQWQKRVKECTRREVEG